METRQKTNAEIYVHIPFCVKKCAYCDFFSGAYEEEKKARYFRELNEEIRGFGKIGDLDGSAARKSMYGTPEDYRIVSIFIGGGTPSSVEPERIAEVLQSIRDTFEVAADAEISMEANPGTLDTEKLRAHRRMGVNRLSLGLQSADNALLKKLGRIHTYEEFLENYRAAREAGFTNINIDLMSGLPGQTAQDHKNTLKKVLELQPEHLSCYSLIIEENTPFYALYGERPELLPSEEEDRAMYRDTKAVLREAGYERYEISNYAKPGFECRHNVGYWTGVPYFGFGAAAASYGPLTKVTGENNGVNRKTMHREKNAYSLDCRSLPKEEIEDLDFSDLMAEFMILGLRMTAGISTEEFAARFGQDIHEVYGDVIGRHIKYGTLEEENGRLKLTDYGLDVSNMVFEEFL